MISLLGFFHLQIGLAQVTTGSFSGIVKDRSGAVLPGVTVVIRNVDTGIERSLLTDDEGRYYAPTLPLGKYELEAQLAGFSTEVRSGINLTLGRDAVVNFTLEVGEISEKIVVSGEAPIVETRATQVMGLIDDKKIRDLPLNARNYLDLALLQTSSLSVQNISDSIVGYSGTHMAISGAQPTSNTFMIDGTTTMSVVGTGPASVSGNSLGVEAIREFTIITNPYDAEFGRGSGGTINVVSRSGTNNFNGSLFYFHRNDNMDARNFFDRDEPPEFRRHQFGASAGGPIVPNKTFFFANYEGLREGLGLTTFSQVPSLDARKGIVRGRQINIKPEVKPYLDLFPLPNGRDFGDGRAEYIVPFTQVTDEDYFMVRLDHVFSEKDSIFGRYTINDGSGVVPFRTQQFPNTMSSRNQYLTLQHNRVFSSRLLNTFRAGFARAHFAESIIENIKVDPSLILQRGRWLPQISVSGLTALGPNDIQPRDWVDNTFDFYDGLTYTRGRHALKTGIQLQRIQQNGLNSTRLNSRWSFSTIESFLQGNATSMDIAFVDYSDVNRAFRQTFWGAFVQDNIQLSPRLTLNLGLRGEYVTTLNEKYDRLSRLPLDRLLTVGAEDIITGSPYYENPGLTLAQRVGLAWDPKGDGKSSVRAGLGIFYDHVWSWWIAQYDSWQMAPWYSSFTFRPVQFPIKADELLTRLRAQQGRQVPLSNQAQWVGSDVEKQYMIQYGLHLQREILPQTVVKVGYSGSRGVHLPRRPDYNDALPEKIVNGLPVFSLTPVRRNQKFEKMTLMLTDSDSFYHALLLELNRRFSNGVQFQISYTFSKSIDEGTGANTPGNIRGGTGTPLSREFKHFDRAISSFDIRNNFVANFTVDLPFGSGRAVGLTGVVDKILGHWQVNGIMVLTDGVPFQVSQGTSAATSILGGSRRPDLASGKSANPVLGGPDRYFDPGAFLFAPPERHGNVGRNTVIGPGLAYFDLGLVKSVPLPSISEACTLSIRAEFFNITNRANFSLPASSIFDSVGRTVATAGRITSTVSSARQIQLGMKLSW